MPQLKSNNYIVGIDEAGRGPLAGPLAVGFLAIPSKTSAKILRSLAFPALTDSKKLSETGREHWYREIKAAERAGNLKCHTVFISPKFIDRHGMAAALRKAVAKGLEKLAVAPKTAHIKLDGALKAPAEFIHQHTIVKGDEKEPVISLASVVAKVERDGKMRKLAKKFPQYGFERHKGYGTKRHTELIHKYGSCSCHRQRFLGKIK